MLDDMAGAPILVLRVGGPLQVLKAAPLVKLVVLV
jgi:hypothetical protein